MLSCAKRVSGGSNLSKLVTADKGARVDSGVATHDLSSLRLLSWLGHTRIVAREKEKEKETEWLRLFKP